MNTARLDAPFKIMIKELNKFVKLEELWTYPCGEIEVHVTKIHIQGEINKTAGFLNEILIIYDGTAKAKVTRGPQVPGDFSWVTKGEKCSVIGTLVDKGKIPHIEAIKIAKISNKILLEMWPFEVIELKNIILDKVSPSLQGNEFDEINESIF